MKLRLVVGILGIIIFAFVGITNIVKLSDNYKAMEELTTQVTESRKACEELNSQSEMLLTALTESGHDIYLNNEAIADTINTLQGSELLEIKAIGYTDGILGDVLTTSTLSDVAFFGSDVSYISYTLQITEEEKFLQSIKELDLLIEELDVNTEDTTAVITVPVVTNLVNGSEIENNNNQAALEEAESVLETEIQEDSE